jgi:hypothetical protein
MLTNDDPQTALVEPRHRPIAEPVAWRVAVWRQIVPMSHSKFYEERAAGRIETVKLGAATLVVTSPKQYVASLRGKAA